MKRFSLIVGLLLVVLLMAACAPAEPANKLEAVQDAGLIVVGTSADYPPFESIDEAGNMVGFDIDLMNEIGKRMGVDVEIRDMPFDSLIAAVQEDKIDASIAAFNYTEERDEVVDFTDAYYYAEDGLLVLEDWGGEINVPEDMANYTVGVQTGSTADGWVTENLIDAGLMSEDDVYRYERMDQAAQDVKAGRIEILMTDAVPAQALADELGGLKIAFQAELSTGPVNIITPQGENELTEEMNKIIAELLAEGYIDELATKFIGN